RLDEARHLESDGQLTLRAARSGERGRLVHVVPAPMVGQAILRDPRRVIFRASALSETTLGLREVGPPAPLPSPPIDHHLHPGSTLEGSEELRVDLRPGHLDDHDPPRTLRIERSACAHAEKRYPGQVAASMSMATAIGLPGRPARLDRRRPQE